MHLEKTVHFSVSRDTLWGYVRDKTRFQTIGYVEQVHVERGDWPAEGTRGTIQVRLKEKKYHAPFTIERYKDASDLVARVTGGALEGAAFYFHAKDGPNGGSVLTGGFRLGGLLGFAARASGLQERIASAVDRELLAFKDRVEKEAGQPTKPAP
ncbi:MAG TPA: hypothetical protein VNZ52_14475 [Candidatus Thermoplasmatota archaeon]|nr:hypothetical protein [Candidatus Thermoplasmatota archaeon]